MKVVGYIASAVVLGVLVGAVVVGVGSAGDVRRYVRMRRM